MNTGIEILIARMKDHPEEFYEYGRWQHVSRSMDIFTKEEREAWEKGMEGVRQYEIEGKRELLTDMILKELAGEGESRYKNGKIPLQGNRKPTHILTSASIVEESLKILADNLTIGAQTK